MMNKTTNKKAKAKAPMQERLSQPTQQKQKKKNPSSQRGSQLQIAAPVAFSSGQLGSTPNMRMANSGKACRVVHRELIASISGTVAFSILVGNSFALNPGIAATFPWLSTVAQAWERYKFRRLVFKYYTRTGTNIPGSLMMAPDYDASDAAPSTEQIMSSFEDVAEDAPWKDITCVMKNSSMNGSYPEHFCRGAALLANQDIKTYDVGNLFVGTVDGTAVNWGKLWVEYDVDFFIPQLAAAGAAPFGGNFTGANTQSAANPFGIAPTTTANTIGVNINGSSVIAFLNVGDFEVAVSYIGTVITVIPAPTASAGATLLAFASSFPTAATSGTLKQGVRITAVPATLSFSLTATTITTALCSVGQAPSGSLL